MFFLFPNYSNFNMDTDAKSHMTVDAGILSSYFNSSNNDISIVVGSGHLIPIHVHGSAYLSPPYSPFYLNNVLLAPHLVVGSGHFIPIHVHKFTTDNHVSSTCDPFGFSVHELQTGTRLLRCDSTVNDLKTETRISVLSVLDCLF